ALAPFASPRARIYAERVASIQSVEVALSRPTDVLPPAPDPAGPRTVSLSSMPAIAETGAIASSVSVSLAAPPRRRAGLIAAAIAVAIAAPAAAYFGLRSRGDENEAVPALSSSPSVADSGPPVSVAPAASALPSASAPVVDPGPPAASAASAAPVRSAAPLLGPRRSPAGSSTNTPSRPGYEGPRR
ncbi:MAG: hypothetical protein ACMG6S_29580, partial [Byssovorax sp.]